jgi:hypothetical protein
LLTTISGNPSPFTSPTADLGADAGVTVDQDGNVIDVPIAVTHSPEGVKNRWSLSLRVKTLGAVSPEAFARDDVPSTRAPQVDHRKSVSLGE